MNMKYTEKPEFKSVNILGKTVDSVCGTIDRKQIARVFITEELGFGVDGKDFVAVKGDENVTIKTVAKADETEVFVELVGGIKSLATAKFYGAYVAGNKENADVTDIYVTGDECSKIGKLSSIASGMNAVHPECAGEFKFTDKDGKRVFLRAYRTDVGENGKLKFED